MGQIIIEIPQNGAYVYQIQNADRVKKLLSEIEQITAKEREEEDEDILGLWNESEPVKRAANR
ncbi:MAG TPA: hypothetical protein VGC97_01115 [Pyrinomonadaceae bacterium]|jgi:hypothetical protein